ncbi:SCO2322 family protein [Streptomyces laurentii]|uniref:SCO2322 family protein n=1 Tax=Streptomyces laurentii TaxID=39478 RepID=UPI0036A9A9A7
MTRRLSPVRDRGNRGVRGTRAATRVRTALAAGLLALLSAVAVTVAVAAPAQAAGYRYWSYWEAGKTGWGFAAQGPATARPADGDVIGFRFAVSADSADAKKPSTAPNFRQLCADVPEKAGSKRVAVVIDFGTAQDAPSGETPPQPMVRTGCPLVREDASAAEALAEVAKPLRYDANALLCGISGYPAKGCGEQVALTTGSDAQGTEGTQGGQGTTEQAGPAEKSAGSGGSSGGPSVGLVAGGAAVLALGAAGVWQARRRRG